MISKSTSFLLTDGKLSQSGHRHYRHECEECGSVSPWYPMLEDAEVDEEVHMHKVHYSGG